MEHNGPYRAGRAIRPNMALSVGEEVCYMA